MCAGGTCIVQQVQEALVCSLLPPLPLTCPPPVPPQDYPKAVSHYSMALRLAPCPSALLYSNRAAAYAGMQYYGE